MATMFLAGFFTLLAIAVAVIGISILIRELVIWYRDRNDVGDGVLRPPANWKHKDSNND